MENLILYTSPFEKKRIGKNNDGGYVTVLLPNQYDLFISGGISDDTSFEEHLLQLHPNLLCHAFDGTIDKLPNNHERIIFHPKNLGDSTNNTTNLCEYIEPYHNIFMKIDIEGHEFRIMPCIIEHNLMHKIKQLVIEIHSPGDIQMFPSYFKGLQDIDNNKMFDMLHKINATHTLVHFHANNACKMQQINNINLPHVFELTFIRNDFVTEKIQNTESLPTKLDMKNIEDWNDYILEGFPYSKLI